MPHKDTIGDLRVSFFAPKLLRDGSPVSILGYVVDGKLQKEP